MSCRGSRSQVLLLVLMGCSGSIGVQHGSTKDGSADDSPDGANPGADGGGGGDDGGTVGPLTPLDPEDLPRPDPNAQVIPNLDSAVINLEAVAGAKDYRAFVMEDGVEVLTDAEGHEVVKGATIFCAGQRQRSAPAIPVPEVMRQIEVTNVTGKKTFIVEAIDRLCPFPGLVGTTTSELTITSPDAHQFSPHLLTPVPIVTEATIRAKYGSMIINGQAPGNPNGLPADPVTPKVLKRWTVEVEPLAEAEAAKRRTKDFFADFSVNDPPQWVAGGDNPDGTFHAPPGRGYSIAAYTNKDFTFYATNAELAGKNHVYYDRGQLHQLLPDAAQDTMATVMAIPRKVAHLADDKYLHITFESSTNSTDRRYWWLSVCGPEQAGQTFKENGLLKEWMVLNSGFFNDDGANPSVGLWNCLVVFPHGGIMTDVPTDAPSGSANPQGSIIVTLNKGNTPLHESVVQVSPQQLSAAYPRIWYRTMENGTKVTTKGILDEYIQTAPRVRFDVYLTRNRLVMFVNGEQRICNNFGSERLTMAEAAIGFNDALYHSSAEHTEMQLSFADRTGQLHYLQNTIFADQHTYDNVGFEESVGLPASFTDVDCYTHKP